MDEVYQHWMRRIVYTAGVKALAEEFGAYWLIDAVASHQPYAPASGEEFQVWRLKVFADTGAGAHRRATLTMDDGNGRELIRQEIEFTDFPEGEVTLYLVGPAPAVLMLPCEY